MSPKPRFVTQRAPWWRLGPTEAAWHALDVDRRRAIVTATAGGPIPASARDAVASLGRDLADELMDLAVERPLDAEPELGSYVRHLFPSFGDAQALAQSAGSRGNFQAGDPYYTLATYAPSGEWPDWSLPEKKRSPAERRLLEAVTRAGGRVKTRELASLLPGLDEESIDAARERLAAKLILFHGLATDTLDLEVGFLASTRDRLRGPAAPVVSLVHDPEVRYAGPILARDAVALLLDLAREPAKVKRDGGLYAKASERLRSILPPLPGWTSRFPGLDDIRFATALRTLQEQGLIAENPTGLAQSAEGRDLLARPAHERTLSLIPGRGRAVVSVEESFFGVAATSTVSPKPVGHRWYGNPYTSPADRAALKKAVVACFAPLEVGRFYGARAFIDHAKQRGGPLARGADPRCVIATLGHETVPPVEATLADASARLLQQLLWTRLFLVGGIEIGELGDPERTLVFALTSLGRHYLGLDPAPPPPAADRADRTGGECRAIVQPNFEVVLMGARPDAVADLVAFTENAGIGGHDDHAQVFKITKASVLAAARAGMTADALVGTLERLSSTPVPDNVTRGIRDWAGSVRRVSVSVKRLVQCPDEDTLARVLSALGTKAKKVSLALVLDDELAGTALAKKLAKLGVVLDIEEEDLGDDEDDEDGFSPYGPW